MKPKKRITRRLSYKSSIHNIDYENCNIFVLPAKNGIGHS